MLNTRCNLKDRLYIGTRSHTDGTKRYCGYVRQDSWFGFCSEYERVSIDWNAEHEQYCVYIGCGTEWWTDEGVVTQALRNYVDLQYDRGIYAKNVTAMEVIKKWE